MDFQRGFKRGAGEASGKLFVYALVGFIAIGAVGFGGYIVYGRMMQPIHAVQDAATRSKEYIKDKAADIRERASDTITKTTEAVREKADDAAKKTGTAWEAAREKARSLWRRDDPPRKDDDVSKKE